MKISCCRNCVPPKRKPGCHDHCEEYQREKAERTERKANIDRQLERERDMDGYEFGRIERYKKKK